MELRDLFFLLNTVYLLLLYSYSKTEYLNCDFLILKIKKTFVGFNKGYMKKKNKWIKVENVKFLEKKIFYMQQKKQKKCFNKNFESILKLPKLLILQIFDYQNIVNNDFYQIYSSNKCFKRNKGKI